MDIIGHSSTQEESAESLPSFHRHRVVIAGTGNMGSWLAETISRHCPVAVFDTNAARMAAVTGVQHLDELEEIRSFKPTMLVNAVALRETESVYRSILPLVDRECILVDIMSVKGTIPDFYRKAGNPFVSIHPMFGPGHADMADLSLENAVIISESSESAAELWDGFLRSQGIMVHSLPFAEHDAGMALSLTLPFAASMVFAASLLPGAVPGTTFTRHKLLARRLFMEDDFLLAEVLFNPRSREMLNRVCSSLEYLKHVIEAGDCDLAGEFFAELRKKVKDDRVETSFTQ